MYFRYTCRCGESFDLHLLSGMTRMVERPGLSKTMDILLYPAARIDHHIETRWGHPLGLWLQEWLHTSKYHLSFYSMVAGIACISLDHPPLSLISAFLWGLLCFHPLAWTFWKVQRAGKEERSGDTALPSFQDMLAMKSVRAGRSYVLYALLFTLPLVVILGPDLFTAGVGLIYLGLLFATTPHVPPSKRKVWSPPPKLGAAPT